MSYSYLRKSAAELLRVNDKLKFIGHLLQSLRWFLWLLADNRQA